MKLGVTTRDVFEIENGDDVVELLLHFYQIDRFQLLNAMRLGELSGELFVYMIDMSDPKDGVVKAPEFYLDVYDDTQEPTWGPIKWTWVEGDQKLIEDPLPGFTAFEKYINQK